MNNDQPNPAGNETGGTKQHNDQRAPLRGLASLIDLGSVRDLFKETLILARGDQKTAHYWWRHHCELLNGIPERLLETPEGRINVEKVIDDLTELRIWLILRYEPVVAAVDENYEQSIYDSAVVEELVSRWRTRCQKRELELEQDILPAVPTQT
jgi:hypothetical protein